MLRAYRTAHRKGIRCLSLCGVGIAIAFDTWRYNLGRLQGPRAIGRTIAHRSQGLLWRSATDDAAPTPSATLNRTVNAHANSRNNPVHPWRTRSAGRGQIDAGAILTASSNSLPLANKKIVCLGALRGLSVDETRKLIEQLGATWCTAIQPGVHYVIACGGLLMDDAARQVRESIALADNPSEEHDATDVPPSISHLRVLSERQFLALIRAASPLSVGKTTSVISEARNHALTQSLLFHPALLSFIPFLSGSKLIQLGSVIEQAEQRCFQTLGSAECSQVNTKGATNDLD